MGTWAFNPGRGPDLRLYMNHPTSTAVVCTVVIFALGCGMNFERIDSDAVGPAVWQPLPLAAGDSISVHGPAGVLASGTVTSVTPVGFYVGDQAYVWGTIDHVRRYHASTTGDRLARDSLIFLGLAAALAIAIFVSTSSVGFYPGD